MTPSVAGCPGFAPAAVALATVLVGSRLRRRGLFAVPAVLFRPRQTGPAGEAANQPRNAGTAKPSQGPRQPNRRFQ